MNPTYNKLILLLWAALILHNGTALALSNHSYLSSSPEPSGFPLLENNTPVDIYIDDKDHKGLKRAVQDLKTDIRSVTGIEPNIVSSTESLKSKAVFIGTIGKSSVIDNLIREGKLDVTRIKGKWESFVIEIITDPVPNVSTGH